MTTTPHDLPSPHEPPSSLQRSAGVICRFILVGLFLYYTWWGFHRIVSHDLADFRTFYDAGTAVSRGESPYDAGEKRYIYPPLIATLCSPLAHLRDKNAARVVMPINLACIVLSTLLSTAAARRRLGGRRIMFWPAALLAAGLAVNQTRAVVQMIETDALMLMCFALVFWWIDRRPVLAGVAFGFAINIKYLPLAALPYLLVRRRWKLVGATVAATIGWALLPALVLGWQTNLRYLNIAAGGLLPWVDVAHNQTGLRDRNGPVSSNPVEAAEVHSLSSLVSISITSAMGRFARAEHLPSPDRWALLGAALIALVCLGFCGSLYARRGFAFWRWPASRHQQRYPYGSLVALEWALVVVLCLAFSPHTNTRHLIIVTIVNAVAAVILLDRRRGVPRAVLWAGVAVMLIGFLLPLRGSGFDAPGHQVHPFSHAWFFAGAAGWALLVYGLTLVPAALAHIRAMETDERGSQISVDSPTSRL